MASCARHCERSEAIHSFFTRRDGLLRLARNDVELQTRFHDLAAQCARGVAESSAQRGRGECRMPNAPAVSCALVVIERTRATTSTPESPGIPARNGFNGFLRALPGDRALLPPSPSGYVLSKPGWADLNSANLTPASGRQDHTTSPYAATSFVSSPFDRSQAFRQPALQPRCAPNAAASTTSHPAFVTTRDRPSCRNRTAGVKPLIWGFGEAEVCPSCQSVATRRAIPCRRSISVMTSRDPRLSRRLNGFGNCRIQYRS